MITKVTSAVLLVLVGASGALAQEKVRVSEHLNWVQTGYGEVVFETNLNAPDTYPFDTGPFLRLQVQPSPKADALFFELWGQSVHQWWVGHEPQRFWANIKMDLVSNLIPNNVEVYVAHGLTNILGIAHTSNAFDRNKRTWKVILRRDSMLREYTDWWDVRYSDGTLVPPEQAQRILNALMDGGFGVEVSVNGEAEGVRSFFFYAIAVEVTRLVKKQ